MEAIIHGYKSVKFNNDNGEIIEGTTLYLSYPANGVEGEETNKFFIRKGTIDLPIITPGETYNVDFDPKGKLYNVTE